MGPLGCLGIGLSLVSGCLFLAIIAELYYFFWWKKRKINRNLEENYTGLSKELLHLFNWKKPSFPTSTALNPQELCVSVNGATDERQLHLDPNSNRDLLSKPFEGEDTVDAELVSLAGPPRSLFTISEETLEDLEPEDGRYRVGKSLRELLLSAETPILTPLSSPPFFSPPLTPMACYKLNGLNPLFEPSEEDESTWVWSSPPPNFKFLKDAEKKLHKKTLMEEALKVHRYSSSVEYKGKIEASVPSLPTGPVEENGFISSPESLARTEVEDARTVPVLLS